MRSILLLAILAMLAPLALAAPPPTDQRPTDQTLHGVTIADPFQWLEGDNSDPANMGILTEEVATWTDGQNAYTRDILDNLPGREQLESRLRELMEVGSVGAPTMRMNRYFYSKRLGSDAQSKVYMRVGHDGKPKLLLDPEKIDPSGLTTISWYTPNHDGSLLAFGMYRSGDENSTLYILNVNTGDWLADEIPGKVWLSGWMPDSKGFFYSRLEDLDDPYSSIQKYHRLGTHHSQDKVVQSQRNVADIYEGLGYTEDQLAKLATTWGPGFSPSRDGRWAQISYWTGTDSNDLWIADLDHWFRTGELKKTPIMIGKRGRSSGTFLGDTYYLQTAVDSPNGRYLAIDPFNPAEENWTTIIPERPDAVLGGVSHARGILAASYMINASDTIELFTLDGTALGNLELPGIGSAGLSTARDRTEAFLTFTSYNEPRSIYRIDLANNSRTLWERPEIPVDPSLIDVKQVTYNSKDGTPVTMFIVHRTGLVLDGTNPTILYGYGGFNISMTPSFSSTMFPWYEAGGVYAIANLRGGGEYGDSWHKAGMLDQKQNVFDDFIAAAEYLIDEGYTAPEYLGIAGGSNGGLLTGAAVTQRPDLFAAAISAVPLLDMLRYQDFLMARYWVPEYGSAEDPEQFEYIRAYSPYHNVVQGTQYPAVLVTAGENDTRVHPMHARKFAAALQAATTADPQDAPILLWVDRDAGHGAGKPLELRIRDVADQRVFMMWQTGMLETP